MKSRFDQERDRFDREFAQQQRRFFGWTILVMLLNVIIWIAIVGGTFAVIVWVGQQMGVWS